MKKLLLVFCMGLISVPAAQAQTKKELSDKIIKQQKTIDSLQRVVDNFDNIVENRDRSLKIAKEDVNKAREEQKVAEQLVRDKHKIIQKLRAESATGEAKMMTLSNARSTLKVKEGKYWVLNQFITDYTSDITKDSLGQVQAEEVHVFLKAVDNKVLTDVAAKQFGPKLYSSLHPEQTIQFPILLTENTKFTIIVMKGEIGNLQPYEGKVYCSFTERDK